MFNARVESVSTTNAFRRAYAKRRCLVPADGWYEWQAVDGRKQPMYMTPSDGHSHRVRRSVRVLGRSGPDGHHVHDHHRAVDGRAWPRSTTGCRWCCPYGVAAVARPVRRRPGRPAHGVGRGEWRTPRAAPRRSVGEQGRQQRPGTAAAGEPEPEDSGCSDARARLMHVEIPTPSGPATAEIDRPGGTPIALLVLTHGAGGGVASADVNAVRGAALKAGIAVARLTQPYRVAGRRSPPTPAAQDAAWLAALAAPRRRRGSRRCRWSSVAAPRCAGRLPHRGGVGRSAVVALAFPLHPPGRPEVTRSPELDGAGVPVLVVQGDRDRSGCRRPGRCGRSSSSPVPTTRCAVSWSPSRGPSPTS